MGDYARIEGGMEGQERKRVISLMMSRKMASDLHFLGRRINGEYTIGRRRTGEREATEVAFRYRLHPRLI